MLNQQLIEDMFQDEPSSDHPELPPQQCSLNYTVSSRSSKHHKKQQQQAAALEHSNDSFNILSLASTQLCKFNQWLADSELKFQQNISSISTLLSELQSHEYQSVSQEDLSIIKSELFRKQNQQLKHSPCKECQHLKAKVQQLETLIETNHQTMGKLSTEINDIRLKSDVAEIKEHLLGKVQLNLLNAEIMQLNQQILTLKSQKQNLERTFLFNKTRNSDIQIRMELQKSKGLSAAKNSTNSSEIMGRNQQTIVFIDPVESDVEEWIKFFQIQKNRYMNMCKKQQGQRIKALGRNFTKEERNQLHSEGRIFIIFSSIKDIWKNLIKIRQNTRSFLAVESSRSILRQKLMPGNQSMNGTLLRQQYDKINAKLLKTVKLNEYLTCEKDNLTEINSGLRKELLKLRRSQSRVQEDLNYSLRQVQSLEDRLSSYQHVNKLQVFNRFK